jgi:methyl-accepting chemotaxis protein
MYIKLSTLGFIFIGLLVSIVLVYLIILIHKLTKTVSKVNLLLDENDKNISKFMENLPKASENLSDITDNLKLVSEVVTETTASAIETKENISEYLTIAKDIIQIIRTTFKKVS